MPSNEITPMASNPARAAWTCLAIAIAFWIVAFLVPEIREFAVVSGLAFFFLIGGVISWDGRGGH